MSDKLHPTAREMAEKCARAIHKDLCPLISHHEQVCLQHTYLIESIIFYEINLESMLASIQQRDDMAHTLKHVRGLLGCDGSDLDQLGPAIESLLRDRERLVAILAHGWAIEPTRNGQWVVMTFNGIDAHNILARENTPSLAIDSAIASQRKKGEK